MHYQGFSLLELIVAVGLFAVVATIAIGALLAISKAGKKAFYIQTNQDNVRFTLETIAREARTGFCYQDTSTNPGEVCPAFATVNYCKGQYAGPLEGCFQFRNSRGQDIVYIISTSAPLCGGSSPISCILKSTSAGAAGSFFPVTAKEVQIVNLKFRVFGEVSVGEYIQPRVMIVIRAQTPGINSLSTVLDVETSVSQLQLDRLLFAL